jgi:subtilisin family serine protease
MIRGMPVGLAAALTALLLVWPAGPAAGQARVDRTRAAQWYLPTMRVSEAHRITQGEGQVIAVLDTGVNPKFPDLAGSVLPGLDSFTKDGKGWVTVNDHGTSVAALAAGHGHGPGGAAGILGIAPKAKVLPMGVWPPGKRGVQAENVAVSIKYVVDHGATVILIAGGGEEDDKLLAGVRYAHEHGVPVVAAAGNRDTSATIRAPASYDEALAISCVDKKGNFSTVSVDAFGIDFAAPCVDIPVPKEKGSGYVVERGTSLSSAITAGAVALLRSRYPELSAEQIFQQLKDTAVDKGKKGYDFEYGWGRLDLMAALTTTPASPTPSTRPRFDYTTSAPADEGMSFAAKLAVTIGAVAAFLLVVGLVITLTVRALVKRRRRAKVTV